MRILIDYRPALRQRSGVGEYIFRLLQALRQLQLPDDQLAIFSSSWKDRVDRSVLDGIRVVDARIPVRLLNRLWHGYEWPPVETLAGAFDVVHAAGPTLMPAKNAAQLITVHDLDFLAHPERTWAEMRKDYPQLVQQHSLRADHVVVNSAYTAGEVHQRLGVPLAKITVCRPGAPDWTARAAPPADGGYYLFVGTLEQRKNIGGLLDSYRELLERMPDAPRLVLAGNAGPHAKPWLEQLSRPPLEGHATHLGYVPDSEREALYKGAAALVLPSFNEGFGLPVLEAMTVGVPVIASNRGALPEVLGDAGMLIDPDEADSLGYGMERIVTDTTTVKQLINRGLRRTRLFDWSSSARALRTAYDEAVEAKAARGQREGWEGK